MPVRRISAQHSPEKPAACQSSGGRPCPRLTIRTQSSRGLLNQVFGALSLRIEYRPVESLRPARRNARVHSSKQIQKIAASFRQFGIVNPLLISPDGEVYAGNGRLEAAKLAGIREVPTIVLAHLTPAQRRAYLLADNKLSDLAGWDRELLALELKELEDLNFPIEVTGFDTAEIDLLIDDLGGGVKDKDDILPPIQAEQPVICAPGDKWILGRHALKCGSALDLRAFEHLLGRARARMAFLDPPYNVPIPGHASGLGKACHRDFAMASGEMDERQFTEFLETSLGHVAAFSRDGAIHFVCMDWRHCNEVTTAGRKVYSGLKNVIVWVKTNGGMGTFYRSQHELTFVYKCGTAPHINNFGLGEKGRYRTNVWTYPGVNTFRRGREADLADHPTVKPVAMVADAIRDCSKRGDIILDAFGGSGTTLIACEKTGRSARLLEIDPRYVDVTIRRWQALTGEAASNAASGQTFDQMLARVRAVPASEIIPRRRTRDRTRGNGAGALQGEGPTVVDGMEVRS